MSANAVDAIERAIGYRFRNAELLQHALTHASTVDVRLESNERLEFLGDAVLGMIVCEAIYEKYPSLLEGEMTKIKSSAVSRHACAQMARSLGIEKHLKIGKGMQSCADLPSSLGAALLEAIIAGVYLDGGFDSVKSFVRPLVDPLIDQAADSGHQQNFKSLLQQHVQQSMAATPCYRVLDEKGPDHAKCFKVAVEINGRRFTPSWGQSKKRAEQAAALLALRELGVVVEDADRRVRIAAAVLVNLNGQADADAELLLPDDGK